MGTMASVTIAQVDHAARWAFLAVDRIASLAAQAHRLVWSRPEQVEAIRGRASEDHREAVAAYKNDGLWSALYLSEIAAAGFTEPLLDGQGSYAASLHFALPGLLGTFAGRIDRMACPPDGREDEPLRVAAAQRQHAYDVLPVKPEEFTDWGAKRITVEHRIAVRFLLQRDGQKLDLDSPNIPSVAAGFDPSQFIPDLNGNDWLLLRVAARWNGGSNAALAEAAKLDITNGNVRPVPGQLRRFRLLDANNRITEWGRFVLDRQPAAESAHLHKESAH